jgi:hypothetical protein
MRTRLLIAGVVTTLGLAVAIPSLSASASGTTTSPPPGSAANPLHIDLITTATAINNFVDLGPVGLTTGDLYVFSDDVFLASDPTAKVGRAEGRCILIDPPSRFGCTIITSLGVDVPTVPSTMPRGTITTEGTLIDSQGKTSTGAVTGGTGSFRNARGEGTLLLGPAQGPHYVTFQLILSP